MSNFSPSQKKEILAICEDFYRQKQQEQAKVALKLAAAQMPLWTKQEALEHGNISRNTLLRWEQNGKIRAYDKNGKPVSSNFRGTKYYSPSEIL